MKKSETIKQAVILAGGYGTRLKPFTDTNPKPMYPCNGKPFLEYLIEQVREFGIKDLILLLGYLPEKISDYFGDGSKWKVRIRYYITPVEYETGLRIRSAGNMLEDTFLLLYCDNYCPINLKALEKKYVETGADLVFTAYRNADGYTKSNLRLSDTGLVTVYDKKRSVPNLQGVDIGYAIVAKRVLDLLPEGNCNFEAAVYPKLVQEKKLYAVWTEHRYYSVGSFERIRLTEQFFSGKKYIFLDRDGTLNVRPPKACYIEKPEDFIWLDGAKDAVKRLKDAGYWIILVTNQPGLSRGNLTEETLAAIHKKMQDDLKKIGACIDHIYYCPHNWEEGCACRKPKPGMFYQAQKEFSIDLTRCYMLGDDERDMTAGEAAGCKCMQISETFTLADAVRKILKDDKSDREDI